MYFITSFIQITKNLKIITTDVSSDFVSIPEQETCHSYQ